jgi:hypothetical protein
VDDAAGIGDLDLGAVNTRDELAALLRTVRVLADQPSLRTLEARTRHTASPLSKTVVSEMLRGVRFPRKATMIAFLEECGVKDDSIEVWRRAWERVAASQVAGKAGDEKRAERARGDRMTAATSASADSAGKGKLRDQAREPPSGVSAVSPAELRVFGAELTQTLRMRGKTSEQAAAELAVPPANVARWTAGQELPSESQARSLDEYLTARGAIRKRVTELRSGPAHPGPRLVPVPLVGPSASTLLQTFQNVAAALRGCLARDADGRPTGWAPDLRAFPSKAAALSTAYGIRTMLLLEDGLAADLVSVAESLREMARPGGGYAVREQAEPRTEATAVVLNALLRIAATEGFDAHIAQMERDLGDFENYRPFILTIMLETSLLLKSAQSLVEILVDNLLATRRPHGDFLLWPEKAEPFRSAPDPSVAHTARAVRVLASVQAIRPTDQVREALEQAVAWLIEQPDLHNAYEVVERELADRTEVVHVRHFTAAWVVKALVSAGVPTSHPAVSNAVAQIWDSYDGTTAALWTWENRDQPIWMTFDAIEALRLASLAAQVRPQADPGPHEVGGM